MKNVLFGCLLALVTAATASADMVMVRIPRTASTTLLQGTVKRNGKTASVYHAMGVLHFSSGDVDKPYKVKPFHTTYRRMVDRARSAKSAEKMMEAARWALKRGMIEDFETTVAEVLTLDANHVRALSVKDLFYKMKENLGDSKAEEDHLRQVVRLPGMQISKSDHFILFHDTPLKAAEPISKQFRPRPPRWEQRLTLLERVYKTFLYNFYSKGVELEVPKERLKVVLFSQEADFKNFGTSLSPALASALGFYDPRMNISFFFDNGSSERMKPFREFAERMRADIPLAIKQKRGEDRRLAETFTLLVEIDRENSDIEVVSHEATHQLAGNTGLFPRHLLTPQWMHEGLATYFESPGEATWSGIGAVNKRRLDWYKELARDREHSNLTFVIGDNIFKHAASHGSILHGYGQAWSLTHFLLENHFDKFMEFYQRVGEMPPDVELNPELLNAVFDDVFKMDRKVLDQQWRSFMNGLKTDEELILGGQ